jgi:hypothetical protein
MGEEGGLRRHCRAPLLVELVDELVRVRAGEALDRSALTAITSLAAPTLAVDEVRRYATASTRFAFRPITLSLMSLDARAGRQPTSHHPQKVRPPQLPPLGSDERRSPSHRAMNR